MRTALGCALGAVVLSMASCRESVLAFTPPDGGAATDGGGLSCGTGTAACGGSCVSLKEDSANCGACGASCAATEACAAGQCYPVDCTGADCAVVQVCLNGTTCTSRACVKVTCGAGQTCVDGVCQLEACGSTACAAGFTCVSGACTDTACLGVTCPSGKVCRLGACVAPAASCSNGVKDGTETDVDCGGTCSACSSGRCCALGTDCGSGLCAAADGGCGQGVCVASGCTPSQCPAPVNAPATCTGGACGRGPCDAGSFDFDGPVTFGCETTCAGTRCTLGDGGVRTLTSPPLAETGLVAGAFASGSSYGSHLQTSATYTLRAVLGEPTPSGVGGATQLSNGQFILNAGFSSIQQKP